METPRICATVAAADLNGLRQARDAVAPIADLVELRLDYLVQPDVHGAMAGRTRPVVATCRPAWEGGAFGRSEEERLAVLESAIALGAEYVDVEWRAGEPARTLLERRRGRGIVLSLHDFEGVPRDLDEQARAMIATGAEIVKIAVTCRTAADNLALLDLGRAHRSAASLVLIGMGSPGIPSRILSACFGSCWTYAGDGVAPGQLPAGRLVNEFRFRHITAATSIYGIVGRPLAHSLSPAMHNAAFAHVGLDAVYVPFESASVEDFRRLALALGVRGVSVTAPFKEDVVPYLRRADLRTRQAGAVNTIRVRGDWWEGRNTDVDGFLEPLRARVRFEGLRVAVIGAGGAARAVAAALAGTEAVVSVHGRRPAAAADVAAIAGGRVSAGPPRPGDWDVLVNTTPVGTAPDTESLPVDPSCLRGGGLVYDLVYNPAMTALRRAAEAAGCETIGGLDMLVAQAAGQFRWWTGLEAPVDVMRRQAGLTTDNRQPATDN
jgi:3-dehydroquinate dehydratase/shikimate dehydrogenase